MLGIVDNDAPPFILISLAWAMGASMFAYLKFAAEPGRESLRVRVRFYIRLYFCWIIGLGVVLLLRIVWLGAIPESDLGDFEVVFWAMDLIIMGLLCLAVGTWAVLGVRTWGWFEELGLATAVQSFLELTPESSATAPLTDTSSGTAGGL